METPVFRLGLVGFNDREARLLRESAGQYRRVQWRCGRAEGADAWMVNGARVGRTHDDGRVRVVAADDQKGAQAVLLDVASRPTAVALPAPQAIQQQLGLAFELRRPETIAASLSELDARLGRLRRLYWIAALLVQCTDMVGKAVYELKAGSHLLALADMKGTVSVSPAASEELLEHAVWKHRSRKMVDVPADFEQHTLSELLWMYTTRTRADLLPERYTHSPLYLRRPPRVPAELIGDAHLRIIRDLAVAPAEFLEIMDRTEIEAGKLRRALAALYYVGSITANPERAWAASHRSSAWSSRTMDDSMALRPSSEGQPSTTPLV